MDTLISVLARTIVEHFAQTTPFRERHLTYRKYMGCYETAFESGVVLGYAFSDRLPLLVSLFCEPGLEQGMIEAMRAEAGVLLIRAGDPKSFLNIAMRFEEDRAESVWRVGGARDADIEALPSRYTVLLAQAYEAIELPIKNGIALGSTYPDAAAAMWAEAYEQPKFLHDEDLRERARKFHLVGMEPKIVTLSEEIEKLLSFVTLYVENMRPDLAQAFH